MLWKSLSEEKSPNTKFVYAIIRMPDGKDHEIAMPSKVFSSGRHGYYAQIPSFVYNNEVYGGQIQLWKKDSK